MKYEGVCIAVKDVNLSKQFYQDLFGLMVHITASVLRNDKAAINRFHENRQFVWLDSISMFTAAGHNCIDRFL